VHEFGNPGKDLNFESVIKKLDNKHLRLIRSEPLQHFLIMKSQNNENHVITTILNYKLTNQCSLVCKF
jgi:hypothetical protein